MKELEVFAQAFMVTYQAFITPEQLLGKLFERFNPPLSAIDRRTSM
jgi:RasGEF N-terminal motif